MLKIKKHIRNFLHTIRDNFFLKKYKPAESTLRLLEELYPGVNWKRVDFYEGLPWFSPLIAPYVRAQALPKFYSFHRFRIYLKKFDESEPQCLTDIVHEGFHIVQAMHFWNGYGLGFFRGLMIYYNALFLKFGYRQNPFEIPAFDQGSNFLTYYEKHSLLNTSESHLSVLRNVSKEKPLVFPSYNFHYKDSFIKLACSFIFCLLIAVFRPIIDIIVFLIRFIYLRLRPIS